MSQVLSSFDCWLTDCLDQVGAGMRIPPNCFKILHRWGVDLTYMKKTYSNGNRFLRYDTGKVIADMPHGIPEWDFGGSYLMVHRADYHAVLLQKARDLGVNVRPDSRVVKYDWEAPAVEIKSGARIEGDVLIIADGRSCQVEEKSLERKSATLTTILMQEFKARRGSRSSVESCRP